MISSCSNGRHTKSIPKPLPKITIGQFLQINEVVTEPDAGVSITILPSILDISNFNLLAQFKAIKRMSRSSINNRNQRYAICHTPKFALLLLKTFHTSMLKDSSRVDQTNPLLDNQPKLGFGYPQIQLDFQHHQWSSCLLICFKDSPCQVSSLTSQVSSDNCSDG